MFDELEKKIIAYEKRGYIDPDTRIDLFDMLLETESHDHDDFEKFNQVTEELMGRLNNIPDDQKSVPEGEPDPRLEVAAMLVQNGDEPSLVALIQACIQTLLIRGNMIGQLKSAGFDDLAQEVQKLIEKSKSDSAEKRKIKSGRFR